MDVDELELRKQPDGSFAGSIVLPGGQAGLTLRLEVGKGAPSSAQLGAIDELVAGWMTLRPLLEPALFAYYLGTALDGGVDCPVIAAQEDVWPFVSIGAMQVPPTAPSARRLVRLSGACGWEPEQGLEIGVRNGRELLYVGPCDGKGLREPPVRSRRNFADATIQEAALMGVPISEEEFDRVEPPVTAGAQRRTEPAQRRPWWKFW